MAADFTWSDEVKSGDDFNVSAFKEAFEKGTGKKLFMSHLVPEKMWPAGHQSLVVAKESFRCRLSLIGLESFDIRVKVDSYSPSLKVRKVGVFVFGKNKAYWHMIGNYDENAGRFDIILPAP